MKTLALTALLLPLAGCISLSPKPPASLLTLTSATAIPVGQPQRAPGSATIAIAVPSVPQELATLRVPVRSSATTVAYLKDARWIEPINRQFARLLADTVTTRVGRIVVGDRQIGVEIGANLSGELRSFGVDAATGEAVVTFDGILTRASGTPLEKRRFEARVPTTLVEAEPVGAALNQAANQVAGEVAEWVGR